MYLASERPSKTPRPEIIEGIFRESQLVTVSGGFGAGKSPLLVDWAFCIASGLKWCGRAVSPRPVLLLAHETPDWSFWHTWELLGQRYSITPPGEPMFEALLEAGSEENASTAELLDVLTQTTDKKLAWVERKIAAKPNVVLAIDPFTLFLSVDTRKGTHIMALYKWARMLHRRFPAVTFLFSFNLRKKSRMAKDRPSLLKDPRDWLEEASGGLEIQTRSDVRIGMEYRGHAADGIHEFNGWRRGEAIEPMLLISVVMGEDAQGKPLLAGFEPTPLVDEDVADLLSPRMKTVYDGLVPGDTYTVADLAALLPRSTAYNLRNRLLKLGLVEAAQGGGFRRRAE